MPTATAEREVAEQPKPAPPKPPKKSGRLLLIGGLVTVMILAQGVITYLLMPKAASGKPDDPKDPAAAEQDDATGTDDSVEVPIGDFNCSNNDTPGVTIHIDFKLSAVTTSGQAAAFEALLKSHQGRVRQLVNRIVRSSKLVDLNDPALGTIKRLIREEVNRLLRKSYVTEVIISDMRTVEQ